MRARLLEIWLAMQQCSARGMTATGVLPGKLMVRRRAAALRAQLDADTGDSDPLRASVEVEC